MEVVLIQGSPRRDGSTAKTITRLAEEFDALGDRVHRVDVTVRLAELEDPFCVHCSDPCSAQCYHGTALERDLEKMARADAVIVGSPVYFGTLSAPLKAFWDHTRVLRSQHSLLYTVGSAFSVGAARFGGQETTVRAIHDMFLIQGMIVVGDSSPRGIGHQGVALQSGESLDPSVLDRWVQGVREVMVATHTLRAGRR